MANKEKRAKRSKEKAKAYRKQKSIKQGFKAGHAQLDFSSLQKQFEGEPVQYFGYNRERQENESPFDFPAEGLVCMVSQIVESNISELTSETGIAFKIGNWFVSEVIENHAHKVHGAFASENEALDFGRAIGAKGYRSGPKFEAF
ncbi:hypothetical protein ACRN9G_18845 [Shewanella frigidimarina]|uniref:hypothetical protein n=1 Tax=Shewanella frigidimarina TaxID=56812 RepID=UPI003D7A41C3